MRCNILLAAAAIAAVSGCAKSADQIEASYVSPLQYEHYDCVQLSGEIQRVSARAAELTGTQNQKATGDAVAMTIGLVVFWPALIFIKGNDTSSSELAYVRGEMRAIEQASIRKKCGFTFQHEEKAAPTAAPDAPPAQS